MGDFQFKDRRFYAVSYDDDRATVQPGSCIPNDYADRARSTTSPTNPTTALVPGHTALPMVISALLLLSVGVFSWQFTTGDSALVQEQLAAPIVTTIDPDSNELIELQYGVHVALEQSDIFNEMRESFITERQTFLTIDLEQMHLQYYQGGWLIDEAPIVQAGSPETWWRTPAGLYQISRKVERHFSTVSQTYQPWSLRFQGNLAIHAWPELADGTLVEDESIKGSVVLGTEDAQRLFDLVAINTPVLVHAQSPEVETFVYQSRVANLSSVPHYAIADIHTGTVLASSDLDSPAPIASITKLMTALVAIEHIDLDTRIRISEHSLIESVIPRLAGRHQVSLYSLLQLLLLESSNEAAEAIAAQMGRATFVSLMNEKAQQLGMRNTVFTDPSGLDNGNVATLGDLLRLTTYIHRYHNVIFQLSADQYIPTAHTAHEFGELTNYNIVNGLSDFIGGKTGETTVAGQTSITLHQLSIKSSSRTLAIVLLGSSNRTEEVTKLLQYVRDRFDH